MFNLSNVYRYTCYVSCQWSHDTVDMVFFDRGVKRWSCCFFCSDVMTFWATSLADE